MKPQFLFLTALLCAFLCTVFSTCFFELTEVVFQLHDTYFVLGTWDFLLLLFLIYCSLAILWIGIKVLKAKAFQVSKSLFLVVVIAIFSFYFLAVYNFLTGYNGCYFISLYLPLAFIFVLIVDVLRGKKY